MGGSMVVSVCWHTVAVRVNRSPSMVSERSMAVAQSRAVTGRRRVAPEESVVSASPSMGQSEKGHGQEPDRAH